MKSNIGTADKTVRIIAGITAIGLGFYFKSWLGAIGLVPLLTAFIGWCPAYSIFRISTCGSSCCCGTSSCETGR